MRHPHSCSVKSVRDEALSCQEIRPYRKWNTSLLSIIKDQLFPTLSNFRLNYKGEKRRKNKREDKVDMGSKKGSAKCSSTQHKINSLFNQSVHSTIIQLTFIHCIDKRRCVTLMCVPSGSPHSGCRHKSFLVDGPPSWCHILLPHGYK